MSTRVCLWAILMATGVVSGACFDGTRYWGSQVSFPLVDAVSNVVAECAGCSSDVRFLWSTTHGTESDMYYKVCVDVRDDMKRMWRIFRVAKGDCKMSASGDSYINDINALPRLTFGQLWASFPGNGIDRMFLSIVEWNPRDGHWFVSNTNTSYIVRDVQGSNVVRQVKWR